MIFVIESREMEFQHLPLLPVFIFGSWSTFTSFDGPNALGSLTLETLHFLVHPVCLPGPAIPWNQPLKAHLQSQRADERHLLHMQSPSRRSAVDPPRPQKLTTMHLFT